MRKVALVFLVIAVAFFFLAVPAFAGEKKVVDKGGPFENIIATLLDVPINIAKAIGAGVAKLKPINELVFGHELWNEKEANFIRTWYWGFASACLPFFLLVVISTGFKLLYGSINPGGRAEAIESIWRWFGAMALVLIAPLATDLLLKAAGALVDGINTAFDYVKAVAGLSGTIGDWGAGTFSGDIDVHTGSVLGTALVKVFFVGIWWWFNAIYLIRKFVLTAMLCFTPLMALFWALNRNVPAFAIWLGELGSNALMPVAHALVLCLLLGIVDVKNVTDGTWFQVLVAIMTFVPLTETIRNSIQGLFVRWAGIDEAATAGRVTAAAMGLGGILSLGRLAGTVTGKNLPGGGPAPGGPAPGGGPPGPGPGGLTPVPTTAPAPVPAGGGKGGSASIPVGSGSGGPAPALTTGTPFSPGGPSPVPAGYAATASGLIVPAGAASGGGPPGPAPGQAGQTGRTAGAGQPAVLPTGKGGPGPVAARYGLRAADGLVKAGAAAAGAVAGGVVRAGLGAVPGLAPVGERLGGAVGRGTAYLTRGAAGAAAVGGRIVQARREGKSLKDVFGGSTPLETGKNIVSAVHGVAAGKMNISAVMQAPTLRPKYQGSVGGLDKRAV